MEFLTILIVFAILSRILEALGGGKRGPGTRPPPRHGSRLPPQQQRPRQELPGVSGDGEESPAAARPQDAAAEMIPDELWELLTGQKRQRPAPPPAPAPAPVPAPTGPTARFPVTRPAKVPKPALEELESQRRERDEEAEAAEFVLSHRRDEAADVAEILARQRSAGDRPLPEAVSLETEPLPEPQRHRRFHERVDVPAPVVVVARTPAERLGLSGPADLRRAFILREVLGPPRGLEEGPLER